MYFIAWILSVSIAFYGGYKYGRMEKTVQEVKTVIAEKVVMKKEPKKDSTPVIIDPLDFVQQAQFEHEQMMDKLNPK